jgi:drug/metabolite transporter (DMT)-like permease
VFFLGERIGYRRVSAMAVGFIGVLIIIRPGMDGFDVYTMFALIGVIGMAIRDFATRIVPSSISTAVLSLYGSLSVALAGALILAYRGDWIWPDGLALLYCAGLTVAAALGTYVVVSSLRLADISSVSPYRFTRVIFGVAFGVLIFGETMDILSIVGALIVVGAALYTWCRERALQQATAAKTRGTTKIA